MKSHTSADTAPKPSLNPGTLMYTCVFTPERSLSPAIHVKSGLIKRPVYKTTNKEPSVCSRNMNMSALRYQAKRVVMDATIHVRCI